MDDERCEALTYANEQCGRKATEYVEGIPLCMQHARTIKRWRGHE